MTPRIVDVPEFTVVGVERRFISILSPDRTNDVVIPKLWVEFAARKDEIQDRVGSEDVGLVYCLDNEPKSHPNECLYICGAKVSRAHEIPPGMLRLDAPGGRYAVFTHQGPPDKFEHTMKFIYGSWFPKSGYEFDDRPEMEFYESGIDADALGWDIYIPIK